MNWILLKIGGSIISKKSEPFSLRPENIKRLCEEIYKVQKENVNLRLLIGHGSGAFGHAVASKYSAPYNEDERKEIHAAAQKLHAIMKESLQNAENRTESFPLASLQKNSQEIWATKAIPIVYGDIDINGKIYSTEMIFSLLLNTDHPPLQRIILATDTNGILDSHGETIARIRSQKEFPEFSHGSGNIDVTGGMKAKGLEALQWAQKGIPTVIMNGNIAGEIQKAVKNEPVQGTLISAV